MLIWILIILVLAVIFGVIKIENYKDWFEKISNFLKECNNKQTIKPTITQNKSEKNKNNDTSDE